MRIETIISKNVRNLMKEKGMSARQIARQTGMCSNKSIYYYTCAHGIPNLLNALKLAKALDTTVKEIANGWEDATAFDD